MPRNDVAHEVAAFFRGISAQRALTARHIERCSECRKNNAFCADAINLEREYVGLAKKAIAVLESSTGDRNTIAIALAQIRTSLARSELIIQHSESA